MTQEVIDVKKKDSGEIALTIFPWHLTSYVLFITKQHLLQVTAFGFYF